METGDRELSQRAPPGPARLLLEDDPPDLIRRRHDRRDAPAASWTRDAPLEGVDHILDPFVDLMDVERAIAQRQRDPDLQLIVDAVPDPAPRLYVEHRAVHSSAPLVPWSRVCRERDRDGEAPGHAGRLALAARDQDVDAVPAGRAVREGLPADLGLERARPIGRARDDLVLAGAGRRPLEPGIAINLCSGVERAVADVASHIVELTGSPAPVQTGPEAASVMARSSGNPERAARLLGWRPRIGFEEALRRTMFWMKEQRNL